MPSFIFSSDDKAEIEQFFRSAWTDGQIIVPRGSGGPKIYLSGGTVGTLGFVYARYGSNMAWTPQAHRNDFAVTTCLSGHATLREGDRQAEWWPGAVRAISADSELTIAGHGPMEMATTTVSRQRVAFRLERWLGHPLEQPIELRQILSPQACAAWATLERHARGLFLWAPPPAAAEAIADYAADIIINLQHHNYSAALAKLPRASDKSVAAAWDCIRSAGDRHTTALDVAMYANVSLASLARAFRELHATTITAEIRRHRMTAARAASGAANDPALTEWLIPQRRGCWSL